MTDWLRTWCSRKHANLRIARLRLQVVVVIFVDDAAQLLCGRTIVFPWIVILTSSNHNLRIASFDEPLFALACQLIATMVSSAHANWLLVEWSAWNHVGWDIQTMVLGAHGDFFIFLAIAAWPVVDKIRPWRPARVH